MCTANSFGIIHPAVCPLFPFQPAGHGIKVLLSFLPFLLYSLSPFFIRHYGALQGLDKQETVDKYGKDQVNVW